MNKLGSKGNINDGRQRGGPFLEDLGHLEVESLLEEFPRLIFAIFNSFVYQIDQHSL
jgi:hypothetical protein